MLKITPVSRKELIKKLKILGFEGPYKGAKHMFMIKGNIRLTLPNPHRKDISVSLLMKILKQAEISREDWLKVSE